VAAGVTWLGVRHWKAAAGFLCLAAVLLPFVYVLVCTLYPSWGDTKCPRCGKAALRRPDRKNPMGVICDECGYEDPEMYRAYLDEME
jgi:hypothetical protein